MSLKRDIFYLDFLRQKLYVPNIYSMSILPNSIPFIYFCFAGIKNNFKP